MNHKELFNEISQFKTGRMSADIAEVNSAPPPDESDPELAKQQNMQVAGLSSRIAGGIGKLLGRSSESIVGAVKKKEAEPPKVNLNELEAIVQGFTYSKNTGRPINEENLGSILNSVETSEDLMRLVDIASTGEEKATKQTFADVAEGSETLKELGPIFKGEQKGLFTAKQQFGLRRLLATTGDVAARLASQIATGDRTPGLLLEYQRSYAAFEALYKLAKGNARDTARALNQQKMLAKVLENKNLKEVQRAIEIYGGDVSGRGIIDSASVIAARQKEGDGTIKSLAYSLDHGLNQYTRAAVELWKNNILSGLGTHATNLSSVAAANLWENFVIRPVASGFGALRDVATGSKAIDRVYASEIIYQQAGAFVGFKSSLKMFADAFVSGESKFGPANKAEYQGDFRQVVSDLTGGSAVGDKFVDASTLSFRLLQAEDDAMRGVVFTSEIYALAARDGRKQGLTGSKLMAHVDDVLKDPPVEIYDMAMAEAARKTFTKNDLKGTVGMLAKYTRGMTGQIPALQFILPFVNTPANLLQYGMDTSILAAVSPRLWKEVSEGGAKADIALAKISTGTSLTMGIWQMYEAGIISGNGPEDFAMQAQMEKEGWKPNAVKAPNGKWYQIKRMEPFSTTMGFVANTLDKAKYAPSEEAAKEFMAHAMLSVAQTALDSSWMSSANDFWEAVGDKKKWDNFQAGFVSSFVPYSAAVRSVEQTLNPVSAKTANDMMVNKGWVQMAKERAMINTPYVSRDLRPSRYWDGSVKQPGMSGFAFAISPIKEGKAGEGDITNRELIRNGVAISEPNPILSIAGVSFSLLQMAGGEDYLYDYYLRYVGDGRREVLDNITGRFNYNTLSEGPNGTRFAALQMGSSIGKMKGTKKFLDEVMVVIMEQNSDILSNAEKLFSADPIAFIKSLSMDLTMEIREATYQTDLSVKQKFLPTRDPLELPSDQSYIPRF